MDLDIFHPKKSTLDRFVNWTYLSTDLAKYRAPPCVYIYIIIYNLDRFHHSHRGPQLSNSWGLRYHAYIQKNHLWPPPPPAVPTKRIDPKLLRCMGLIAVSVG